MGYIGQHCFAVVERADPSFEEERGKVQRDNRGREKNFRTFRWSTLKGKAKKDETEENFVARQRGPLSKMAAYSHRGNGGGRFLGVFFWRKVSSQTRRKNPWKREEDKKNMLGSFLTRSRHANSLELGSAAEAGAVA